MHYTLSHSILSVCVCMCVPNACSSPSSTCPARSLFKADSLSTSARASSSCAETRARSCCTSCSNDDTHKYCFHRWQGIQIRSRSPDCLPSCIIMAIPQEIHKGRAQVGTHAHTHTPHTHTHTHTQHTHTHTNTHQVVHHFPSCPSVAAHNPALPRKSHAFYIGTYPCMCQSATSRAFCLTNELHVQAHMQTHMHIYTHMLIQKNKNTNTLRPTHLSP